MSHTLVYHSRLTTKNVNAAPVRLEQPVSSVVIPPCTSAVCPPCRVSLSSYFAVICSCGQLAGLTLSCQLSRHNYQYFCPKLSLLCLLQAGINYGPPGTKQLVYFVDDLNMPKLDPYETAMPISLIRQHLGWGHWFDRAKLTQKNINNTQ